MTDGSILFDCRSCKHSEYKNRIVFTCETNGRTMTRPRKCPNFVMDDEYAKRTGVRP